MPERTAIGIDIGGSRTRAALVSDAGRIIDVAVEATPRDSADAVLALLKSLSEQVGPKSPAAQSRPIGVCLPGIRDERGVLTRAVNLPRLEGMNLGASLETLFRGPVRVETDVNAAALAQYRAIQPAVTRFVYLALGTGVGGGVVLNGRLVRHTRHGPGHLGHLIVDGSDTAPACRCGARGCLEAHVGGWAMEAGVATALSRPSALAVGLLQIAHLYAPHCVAVGGGVIEHDPDLLAKAIREFETRRSTLVPPELRITPAPLRSDDAGAIGAALLALESDRPPPDDAT